MQESLASHGVPPHMLTLEVTETMALDDRVIDTTLRSLRRMGLRISLDDFGTGCSSLGHLARLPITALKIDRSFVSGPDAHGRNRAVMAATVDLGARLGLDVVAEGVETESQRRTLTAMGCDRLQGFLFGHPARILPQAADVSAAA